MNKEEVLKKSRQENRGKDVADIEASKNAIRAGWIVVVCLAGIITIVDGLVFGRPSVENLFAVTAALAVVFFWKYVQLRKRHELVLALLYTGIALCNLSVWISQMAGK